MKKIIILFIALFALSSFGQEDSVSNQDTIADPAIENPSIADSVSDVYRDTVTDIAGDTSIITIDEDIIDYEEDSDTVVVGDSTFIVKTNVVKHENESNLSKRIDMRREIRCDERMQAGIDAFKEKRYPRAISYLSLVRSQCSAEMDNLDSIYFFLGLSYMNGKKFEDARMEFRTIIEEFPHSEFIEQTYYLIAYSSFRGSPIVQRDNRMLRRAEREFASFISGYPNSEWADSARMYLDSITDKLIEKEILVAEFYEIIRRFESAVICYEVILQDFVGNPKTPEIRLRLARNLIKAQRFAEAEDQLKILEEQNLLKTEVENLRRQQNRIDRRSRRQ